MDEFVNKEKCEKCGEIQTVTEKWPGTGYMPTTTLQPCPKCGGTRFVRLPRRGGFKLVGPPPIRRA